ncbi:phenylalanine--tRNA ligase subunit beta [Candidatus Saccharibacteria bacterium]|nr:phenylalanine--tRNA ligase subunit beta [Candidatus Saccharibacteria bacterium]
MIVSLNWLKKFVDIDMPIDDLETLIGARLVEIESVVNIGKKYENIPIVKVVKCEKHGDSDHLNVVMIDDGNVISGVERDADGLVQVVCGAPNIAAGQMVVWLPPATIVPNTHYTADPFELSSRVLQGVTSNGMIASAKELDLYDEHTGILVVNDDVQPGASFADAYELDDYLLDIENKSLTHRPDCFSIIGFAREVAAITGKTFKTPDWLLNIDPDFSVDANERLPISVAIDNSELSDRYQAIVVSGASSDKQSPMQTQTYLARVGVRPINAVVDVTNYLMMLTGQPLHAFDYDKLASITGGKPTIHVRNANQDEDLQLLDGKTITLSPDDIVIATDGKAIALAGAMGGLDTAIDENTKNIVIESATFNLYSLRSTQMRHGIFSEAITRFTKGQPAGLTAPVLCDAVRLMGEWSGSQAVSEVAESYPGERDLVQIELSCEQINDILGSQFTNQDVNEVMQRVEFGVQEAGEKLILTPPYWRQDIHIKEDIAEEMGRLNGFDNIAPTLPSRDFTATKPSDFDNLRTRIRKMMVRAGANEVLTYSFVNKDLLVKAGQDPENSYKIVNSISPTLPCDRQSRTPSLLNAIHPNVRIGFDKFMVFELNKVHSKSDGVTNENVPHEFDMLAAVVTDNNVRKGSAYYQAKEVIDYLGGLMGFNPGYKLGDGVDSPVGRPFEHRRSAVVFDRDSGVELGIVGEYKKSVSKNFKLPLFTAGFEIDLDALFKVTDKLQSDYKPISRFPFAERDICFQLNAGVTYGKLVECIEKVLDATSLETMVNPIDIYKPDGADVTNVTVRIRFTSHDHTLDGDEVADVIDLITASIKRDIGASVI